MNHSSFFSSNIDTLIASSPFQGSSFITNQAQLRQRNNNTTIITTSKSSNNTKKKRHLSAIFSRTISTALPATSSNNNISRPITLASVKTTSVFRFLPFVSTTTNKDISSLSAPHPHIGLLQHSDANPDIIVARERVQNAEAVERAAIRSLHQAHTAVNEARERVRLLEQQNGVEWRREWLDQVYSLNLTPNDIR